MTMPEKPIVAVLDTETTSLDPQEERIIEFSAVLYRDRALLGKVEQRIQPNRPIAPAAQAVHGISAADLVGKPVFAEFAPKLFKILCKADILVAHNAEFDMSFLICEFVRLKYDLTPFSKKQVFCTMENGRWATPTGKIPSLKELCFATGVDYDDEQAHAALYDTVCCAKALFAGIDTGFFDLKGA